MQTLYIVTRIEQHIIGNDDTEEVSSLPIFFYNTIGDDDTDNDASDIGLVVFRVGHWCLDSDVAAVHELQSTGVMSKSRDFLCKLESSGITKYM